MKANLADLIADLIGILRRAGMGVSVAEAMDAARAAAVVGVERAVLQEALAASLVKDEGDRPLFLAAFASVFPTAPSAVARTGARRGRRVGQEGGAGGRSAGAGGGVGASGGVRASRETSSARSPTVPARAGSEGSAEREEGRHGGRERGDDLETVGPDGSASALRGAARLARTRRLLHMPFRAMTPADVEASAELARALAARVQARLRRRLAPERRGRLDFRRTIRAAVPRGGVPFERRYRGRRPGVPDLVALADLSASAATATGFFLALLAPASIYFRRVRLFGFVDRLVEIEFVHGQVRPASGLDLMARSDFGRVLRDLVEHERAIVGADTVLLVLGDARNNRRPPRADLLATARTRVRRLLWLNPEPRERWDSGDSVMAAYARHADAVVPCGTLAELDRALAAVARL